MAVAEEGPEPLKYQTLALKVSIHCEGCKKKVKKVLHGIEGVYKTDIDIQHQKVVVIGNVTADMLIKKLVKTGKHAEPWPEPAPPAPSPAGGASGGKKKKKNRGKNKNNSPSKPAEPAPPAAAAAESNNGPSRPEKHEHASSSDDASDDEPDKPEGGGGGGGSPKKNGIGDVHDGNASPVLALAMTPYGKQPITPNANANAGGKKKGKKGGGGNANANTNANANGDSGAIVEVNPPDTRTKPASGNAGGLAIDTGGYPPAAAISYPGYYPGAHMPPYVMSYSTAHPSAALRSSAYYHPMVGAAQPGGGGGGVEYFYSTAPASAAPGSYYMFSEENANACSVM